MRAETPSGGLNPTQQQRTRRNPYLFLRKLTIGHRRVSGPPTKSEDLTLTDRRNPQIGVVCDCPATAVFHLAGCPRVLAVDVALAEYDDLPLWWRARRAASEWLRPFDDVLDRRRWRWATPGCVRSRRAFWSGLSQTDADAVTRAVHHLGQQAMDQRDPRTIGMRQVNGWRDR